MTRKVTEKQTEQDGQKPRDAEGRFSKGNPGGPGRPKGEPNVIPGEIKGDILTAYHERGGINWLRGLKDNLFVRLLEKIMPKEIAADIRATAGIDRGKDGPGMSEEELLDLIEQVGASLDGTALMDGLEKSLKAGDLAAVESKLPLLEDIISTRQENADKALAKVERAKEIKAKLAEAQAAGQ